MNLRKNHLISNGRKLISAGVLGLSMAMVPCFAQEKEPVQYLDQGWDDAMRELYYFTPQGSRLMPYSWFLALETAAGETRFSDPANMARYGWLNHGRAKLNPDNLPIGFTKEPANDSAEKYWVGMTCSACHTNDIQAKGKRIRIDGGPALADFTLFITELSAAVQANLNDQTRFGRFAANVLGHDPTPTETAQLKTAYRTFAAELVGNLWMRTPHRPSGPGRVDALNQITNALAVTNLGVPENLRPVSAPVSFPFVWLAPHLDWVQWAPVASSPIARNVGETLGVFGKAEFKDPNNLFHSSVMLKQLHEMEEWLATLKSPPWPEKHFGKVNRKLAKRGRELFDKSCRGCHNMPPFDYTAKEINAFGKQFIKTQPIQITKVGTDPQYTHSLISRITATSNLGPLLFQNEPVTPGANFFLTTVGATLKKAIEDAKLTPQEIFEYNGYRFYPPSGDDPVPQIWKPSQGALTAIKASPLVGIWATGPFLHNGSVPNIYELLSPPNERSKTFWVGSREIDPVKLGYKSTRNQLTAKERSQLFLYDTSLPGNHNSGHAFPKKALSPKDRLAIIEYLKDVREDAGQGDSAASAHPAAAKYSSGLEKSSQPVTDKK